MEKRRQLIETITGLKDGNLGRILVFTGARQVGKTTFVKNVLGDYTYLSIEDPVKRVSYKNLSASQWHAYYPKAALDEVQKEPVLVESIKSTYDQYDDVKYVLLGSSQILLLDKVHESLAGRCSIVEMFTLTLPELETNSWSDDIHYSVWQKMVSGQDPDILPDVKLHPKFESISMAWNHYMTYGGYPVLVDEGLTEDERYRWLSGYIKTYLERDVRDLCNIRDLEPYIKLQTLLAARTGQIVNITDMADQVSVSTKTVQRYLRYLDLSYQTLLLPAWYKNVEKRLVKSPKIHCLDFGVVQALLHKRGGMTGSEYESSVISEIYRQTKNIFADCTFYYLRSQDGAEVDLLVEVASGYYAFEIKHSYHVSRTDARHLFKLKDILDKPLIEAFVLSEDHVTQNFTDNIHSVNSALFLG